MMVATDSIAVKKKLKIKFAGKRIDVDPKAQKYELEPAASVRHNGGCGAVNQNGQNEMRKMVSQAMQSSYSEPTDSCSNLRLPVDVKKRQPPEVLEGPRKKLRMDRSVAQQCSSILKRLFKHSLSWPFKQPVDPLKLQIPDYFKVISNPMDLGTVKSKLDKHGYHGPEEFAADIRLTFSNAMLYNPPDNDVHKMAAALSYIFESGWKGLEAKSNYGTTSVEQEQVSKHILQFDGRGQNGPETPPRSGLKCRLQEKVRCEKSTTVVRVKVSKLVQEHVSKPMEDTNKGTDSDETNASRSKSGKYASHSKCGACGSAMCQCNNHNDSSRASSDLTSTRLLTKCREPHADASKVERSISTVQTSKSDRDFDGTVNTLDDGNVHSSSELVTPATDAACGEGWSASLPDVQLSPQKALRAAILKSRFAGTILKAQQKTLLDRGNKADPSKLQQEKQRLERRQREEAIRIEAQIKAAEAEARMRAEAESRRQREEAREAARIALQEMEKTVEIWESPEILKELAILSGCSLLSAQLPDSDDGPTVVTSRSLDLSPGRKVLESLGLYLEYDFVEEDDDDGQEIVKDEEEGEICP